MKLNQSQTRFITTDQSELSWRELRALHFDFSFIGRIFSPVSMTEKLDLWRWKHVFRRVCCTDVKKLIKNKNMVTVKCVLNNHNECTVFPVVLFINKSLNEMSEVLYEWPFKAVIKIIAQSCAHYNVRVTSLLPRAFKRVTSSLHAAAAAVRPSLELSAGPGPGLFWWSAACI